jgi:outer membrane protein assembly factor BamB
LESAGLARFPPKHRPSATPRWVRSAVGLVGLCSAISLLSPGAIGGAIAQQASEWPSFQGGPAHLGAASGVRPGFRADWRAAPQGDSRLSAPAVVTGLGVSVGAGVVIGFDPATGRTLWSLDRARGPIVPPAIDPTAGEHGVVVYTEGADPKTSALVAVDASSRERLWRAPLGNLSQSAPSLSAGMVFVGARDSAVYAVSLQDGRLAWKAKTQGRVDPSVAVADGRVYAVSENPSSGKAALDAFAVDTGRRLWAFSPARLPAGASAPTVAGGTVFAGFGDGTIRALDAAKGSERWKQAVRADFSPLSSLAFADGKVFALDRNGGLYAFDAKTGGRSWDFQFEGTADRAAPLVSGGFVTAALDDGTINTVDVHTGHLVWESALGIGPLGPLAVSGDLLLVPSIGTRGGVTAYRFDPAVPLIDRASPTEMQFGIAIVNYVVAAIVTLLVLVMVFGFIAGRRPGLVLAYAPPPGWSPRADDDETERTGQGSRT